MNSKRKHNPQQAEQVVGEIVCLNGMVLTIGLRSSDRKAVFRLCRSERGGRKVPMSFAVPIDVRDLPSLVAGLSSALAAARRAGLLPADA